MNHVETPFVNVSIKVYRQYTFYVSITVEFVFNRRYFQLNVNCHVRTLQVILILLEVSIRSRTEYLLE
jgi:hypothetical protein